MLTFDSENYSEHTREETEGFVQSALDALSAHIAILDGQGNIIGVNRAWIRYAQANKLDNPTYGVGTNYLAVCDASAQLNSPEARLVGQGIREVIAQRRDEFHLQYPCHEPKVKRWFILRVTRFDWYGQARFVVAHQDITDQKRVEIELIESQQRIQSIFDTVVNGIVTLDKHSRVETANPAAAQIFGYDREAMIGQEFNTFLQTPCPVDCLQANMDYELMGKRQDGSIFPMYMAMNETRLDVGRLFTVVIQDITERKQMEAQLVEKEKLQMALEKERELREFKSRFMSMMSHELRTPLTSIRLSHDMLTTYADQTSPEERQQFLANISSQVEYLTDLIKDMNTISKAENQQLEFAPEKRDLLTYCRGVVEEFQLAYHQTHRIDFETNCMRLEANLDGKLFRQVLNNLLSNAIKYSPEGGTIRFELMCGEKQATIRVSDEGIGIPPEDMGLLFEPFRRASNVGKLPGTGLGLAIAQQAVELHEGTITAESENGVGTTFTIRLPVLQCEILSDTDDRWD